MRRYKILIFLPSLESGGAERFVVNLLQSLDRNLYVPVLAVIKLSGPFIDIIPSDVAIYDLGRERVSRSLLKMLRIIRQVEPDIVFSTLGYLNIAVGMIRLFVGRNICFIAREASNVSMSIEGNIRLTLYKVLYRIFYSRFDLVIAQTQSQKNDLIINFGVNEKKVRVVPNPVDCGAVQKLGNKKNKKPKKDKISLIAAGRLIPVKGFDLLLKAVVELPDTFHLTVMGDGSGLNELKKLSHKLEVEDRVEWVGFQTNPFGLIQESDLFILSSRYEGFPNVVLEALALGVPVVAFGGPTSAQEIIQPGINGYLAEPEDCHSLAEQIEKAVQTDFDRSAIARDVCERFGSQHIIRIYEKYFLEEAQGRVNG